MLVWYRLLNDRIIVKNRPIATLLSRVFLDQTVFAPSFIAVFFFSLEFMKQYDTKVSFLKLRTQYWDALKMNYLIWPTVQMANFFFVPLNYRLLVVNTVAIGWNGFLSYSSNKEVKSAANNDVM
jgi:protein Mpv17